MSVGVPCPYCHFAIKEGAQSVPCNRCASPHHAECWQENGGCAVPGCATVSAPVPAPPPAWGPPAPPAPAPAAARSTAWRAIVVGAAVGVAVLGAGAALLLLRQNTSRRADTLPKPHPRTVISQTTVTLTTHSTVITTNPSPPPRPRHRIPNLARYGAPQNTTGPGNAIQQYWTLVNEGDYQGAWDMETLNQQRFWSDFVSNREVAQPKINLIAIGNPYYLSSSSATVWIRLYTQDRYPSGGNNDTICRLFTITTHMVRSGSGWLYDGPYNHEDSAVEKFGSPNCHA